MFYIFMNPYRSVKSGIDGLGRPALTGIAAPTRARARRAPIPASSDAERPARAAWAALRLLVDVAISV